MMEKNELNNFIDKMKEAIYKAGEMALGYQDKVKNNKIIWPNGGRIPRVIFGFSPLSEKVLSCLKSPKPLRRVLII